MEGVETTKLEDSKEINMYEKTIADLTEQNYKLMMRIKELTDTQCCGGKKHKE